METAYMTDDELRVMYPDAPSCTCDRCAAMCATPCWPTANEVKRMLDAGVGISKLTLYVNYDYTGTQSVVTEVLAGRRVGMGHNGNPHQFCAFYSEGLCTLHSLKLKPIEGRHAYHGKRPLSDDNIRNDIAATWNTPLGKQLLRKWRREYTECVPT